MRAVSRSPRNTEIVLEYFAAHPGEAAASYEVSDWATARWPGFTRVMAYGGLHWLEKTGRVTRVGESCSFHLTV